MFRVGIGYDVHAFCEGDHITIGGVTINHTKGIKAHSDGDVLLHALTDAMLGSIAAGSIGVHFPPPDFNLESDSADNFMSYAYTLIKKNNIDLKDFPEIKPKWKNASSNIFVNHAHSLIKEKEYEIGNIDLTVICQEPKIMPHSLKIRENIAEILDIDIDQINIKAVTTEGLGSLGRKEGIAAQAIIIIYKKV